MNFKESEIVTQAVLVGIVTDKDDANETERSIKELERLLDTAGGETFAVVIQNKSTPDPRTLIGSGKVAEISGLCKENDIKLVIFDEELTPAQIRNLEDEIGNDVLVIDRSMLILDIFALNAVSGEGKLQVELAQLRYLYPRLKGKGNALSRLGGGIGTRGPGEAQLETDRRHIRTRIRSLEEKLSKTKQRRGMQVERRKKDGVRTVALVGYTNTGKSTLLNALSGADVFVKDALFATLDPTSRKIRIDGMDFLLTDTVGFLQDLPHHLIEAFRSTLESAIHCDLALIVCDASSDYEMQLKTTLATLRGMKFSAPYLVVMNKCDVVPETQIFPKDAICISAKCGSGLDVLKTRIFDALQNRFVQTQLFVPYDKADEYAALRPLLSEKDVRYTQTGTWIYAVIPVEYAAKFQRFLEH